MQGRKQSKPLGAYLVGEGLCTDGQIEKALAAQAVYGGKLGTVLLEQGAIGLHALAKALGDFHHVRAFDPMQAIRIPEKTLALLPPKLAQSHQLVPLALVGGFWKRRLLGRRSLGDTYLQRRAIRQGATRDVTLGKIGRSEGLPRLYVLTMDPSNRRALEEISRTTGYEIVPILLPEVQLRILLERYYGVEQELRFLTLARELAANSGRLPAPELEETHAAEAPAPAESVPALDHTATFGRAGLHIVDREQLAAHQEGAAEIHELSDEHLISTEVGSEKWAVYVEEGAKPAEPAPPPEKEEPAGPLSLSQATALLEKATGRDQIARAVLGLAQGTFARAALFLVRHGRVSGWDAVGEGIDLPLLKSLLIQLSEPSAFQLVCQTRAHFLGALPAGEINEGFLKLLGGKPPRSVFLYPILFQDRVVNLIYGDGGPGRRTPIDVSDLLILGPHIPRAFGRILKARKRAWPPREGGGEEGSV